MMLDAAGVNSPGGPIDTDTTDTELKANAKRPRKRGAP
jgi:hypothetical protein